MAVARSCGHFATGFDLDPLAVLNSRVWTTAINAKSVRREASLVLKKAVRRHENVDGRSAFPDHSDVETRNFLRYWFDASARKQLYCLAYAISALTDGAIRNVCWSAFSRLIIAKQAGASLAMDLAHSRPHKVYKSAPISPFEKFLGAVDLVARNCVESSARTKGPRPAIHQGDARKLNLAASSIDLVLTSPPYLNAIDYMRCSKFSLVWMGFCLADLRALRSKSVGTEVGLKETSHQSVEEVMRDLRLKPSLAARDEGVLRRYVDDMHTSILEVKRVLVKGGKAVYVIGENTVRGTFIPNSKIISALAQQCGMRVTETIERELPENRRYLPPPVSRNKSTALGARMRREAVIVVSR